MMEAKITKRSTKSYTIEVEIPYEFNSMLEAENRIQQQVNKVGMLATGEALKQFDTDGTPLTLDGVKLTSRGPIQNTYQTPYGDVQIERHFYQTAQGGRGHCPLESRARIITTATPKCAKMVTSKYANTSAGQVQIDLDENHGRTMSRSHIQDICDVVGSIASVKEATWNYTIPVEADEVATIAMGVDGTCMLTCDDGKRQAMVGTVSLYDRAGDRLPTLYVAARPEYGKATFFADMEREITKITDRYPTAYRLGVADGAKDNWTFLERFTEAQLIDCYHASEYIGKVGRAAVSKKARDQWIADTCHALKHEAGAAAAICGEMQGFLARKLSKTNRETVEAAVTYFMNNGHRMDYATHVTQQHPIGSGVTESACKVIVKKRLCGAGMRWKEHGASVVLTLRCLRYSDGRWQQFWQKIDRYGFTLAKA
jgi:hypothetical protein